MVLEHFTVCYNQFITLQNFVFDKLEFIGLVGILVIKFLNQRSRYIHIIIDLFPYAVDFAEDDMVLFLA